MDIVGFKMKLHPGLQDEYKKRHDEIWSDLSDLLAVYGIRDYSIFHDPETDILFAVHRKTDGNRLADLHKEPLMQRWWQHMGDVMDTNPDGSPVQKPLFLVFRME